ncbi:MOSC domain-containing protein [Rhizobiaceae bacterium n13]|uniref:MOSC domain-containing protein n=1 Tax=Ferirhizobium litorale TaxID=2927786 RepID=A0AAE3U204_9HYPH|nr:MOSC domain-containing protein [Fererhizobium litorale]MDI7863511.1 MOSC domain-containing protein [Fererhizobium litorale]MDI7922212.1 MOSC domain-containing protein [Fererhizobium litorale]
MTSFPLLGLLVGPAAPLGPRGVPSGIAKSQVAGSLVLSETGLSGDVQGDPTRHGGTEKALHHYPFDHYSAWSDDLGPHPLLASPGAFGENIATSGLTEETVAIGDVFEIGTAVVEVSQGRQPCWKLNERFGRSTMASDVQSTGRTGWYYRVLRPGTVAAGDRLTLVDRASPDWTIERIWRAFYVDTLNRAELSGIARLERLAAGWQDHATRRLKTNSVEDWTKRLMGGI